MFLRIVLLTIGSVSLAHAASIDLTSALQLLTERGAIASTADFRPEDMITRSEAAAMIGRAVFDRAYIDAFSRTSPFRDVPAGTWYSGPIEAFRQSGAWSTVHGMLYPDTHITRAEFLRLLFLAGRLPVQAAADNTDTILLRGDAAILLAEYLTGPLGMRQKPSLEMPEPAWGADFADIFGKARLVLVPGMFSEQ